MLVAAVLGLVERMFSRLQHLQGVGMGDTGRGEGMCWVSHPLASLLAHKITSSFAWWLKAWHLELGKP